MTMQPFGGLGIWVWEAGLTNAEAFCAQLSKLGYNWVAVKTHDGGSAFNEGAVVHAWRAACHKHNLRFGAWGYLTGNAGDDARMAIMSVKEFKTDFYIADAEIEYETAQGPVSLEFCQTFRNQLPHTPAAFSSFGRCDLHSGIDFHSWALHGFDFMPQAYECESGALAPALCIEHAKPFWPLERIYPTLGTYKGALGTLTGMQLYASVAQHRLPGVNVWDAQECSTSQLAGLARLKAARPAPPPTPPPHVPPKFDGKHPFRRLHLTSPLMRGPDVRHFQQACNDRLNWRGVKPLVVDGQFGPATHDRGRLAAFDLGLLDTDATVAVQALVEEPWKRTPPEVARDKARRHHILEVQQQLGKGLLALPKIAAHYLNIHENPANSNMGTPYPSGWEERFGMNGVSWCGCFSGSVVILGGGHVTPRVAYCPSIENDAKAGVNGFDRWTTDPHQAGPGWLALYDWTGNRSFPQHVGVVESIGASSHVAIEGNTGGTEPQWGGMVARETRPFSLVVGYARPRL